MRLLVTRPEPDAETTAEALRRLGHEVMVAPMLTVVPREEQSIDLSGLQAICFTSRNAVRVFAERSSERAITVYVVGPGTALEARDKGFETVREGGGDGQSLVETMRDALSPEAGAILHARGAAVAYDVAGALRNAGFSVREQVVYETLPLPTLPLSVRRALATGALDGILLFSPRSAKTLATLLTDAGLANQASQVTAYCLSEAVRAAARLPWRDVRVASQPDVPSMIRLLEGDEGAMADERKPGEETAPAETVKSEAPQPVEQERDERDYVEAIIAKFGGLRPMATKLDLAVSTVQGWKIRGHIPDQRHEEILKAAREHDIPVSAEDLRVAVAMEQPAPTQPATAPGAGTPERAGGEEAKAARRSALPASGGAAAAGEKAAGAEAEKSPAEKRAADQPKPASAAKETASAPSPTPSPVQPETSGERAHRGGFMPGLFVGALLCAGAVVATVMLRDSWLPMVEEAQGPSIDPAALEQRLQGLAGDLGSIRTDMAALGDRAAGLETALSDLATAQDATPAASPEELTALNAEVQTLSQSLQSLSQSLAESMSDAKKEQELESAAIAAEFAAVGQVLETLSSDLQSQFATLAQHADSLAETSDKLATSVARNQAGTASLSDDLAALSERIDALEGHVSSQQLAERSALLLAFGRLDDAAASGRAYAEPLGLFGDLAGDRVPAEAMAILQQHAASGVQPLSGLQSNFRDASAAIVAASYEDSPSEGVVGDVMRNLTKLVVVRSRDPESAGVDGVVARAEASLNGGDLAGAVAELEGLEGEPAQAAGAWLDDAKARIAVDAALADLSAALDAASGASAN